MDTNLPDDPTLRHDPTTSGEAFDRMMDEQAQKSREASGAFEAAMSRRTGIDELIEDQQRQTRRIKDLDRQIDQLRRGVRMSNAIAITLVLLLLGLIGAAWFRPDALNRLAVVDVPTDEPAPAGVENVARNVPDVGYDRDLEFRIRTDVDRKYQRFIRDLNLRTAKICQPRGGIEDRALTVDYYIQVMTDVLKVAERAQAERVSPEIAQALHGLVEIGKKRRLLPCGEILDPETGDIQEQVLMVVRAPDLRDFADER